jgi:hypothetical protein
MAGAALTGGANRFSDLSVGNSIVAQFAAVPASCVLLDELENIN